MFCSRNVSTNPFLQLSERDGFLDFSLNQLQEVKLQRFIGTLPEMEFVRLLLAKSSALKVMHIQPPSKMVAGEQLKILKEIIRFKRASPEAEIICEDFSEDVV